MPLRPPPRDEHGKVIPHDHDGLIATDRVIRRISKHHIVDDGDGGKRISSMAFKPSSSPNAGLSVDLEPSILGAGLDPKRFVTEPRWMGSVSLVIGEVRNCGFEVGYDPLPTNPHHGELWGQFSRSRCVQLLSLASWYVEIPKVNLVQD